MKTIYSVEDDQDLCADFGGFDKYADYADDTKNKEYYEDDISNE